ncbi:DUF7282 domain-containing protein [Halorussus lipolyticus]|uniref:DUF7282 domain-containing protein n=1 Tax=Halorussus lipolyticus TaxID=3034024 RepID=UPI0023E7774F|nr:hypothetical protein [Halorussus sp. DT80]
MGALAIVAVLLVAGAGVATTGATVSNDAVRVQETTTTTASQGADFAFENLTAPERVRIGTNYTVSATIVNSGDALVARQVSYRIAGNVIEAQMVDVPENGTETIQFNVTANDTAGFPAGTFTHGVFSGGVAATANLTLVEETTAETTTTTATTTETTQTTAAPTTVETTQATTTIAPATETTTAGTTTEANATTTEETTTEAETATITFEPQDSNGSTVTVQSVTLPEGGFVVVHDSDVIEGEAVDSILGRSSYLAPGLSENVTIELDQSLDQSQRLVAITYRDSNDNQTFDFVESNRTEDGPYTKLDSREAVNGIAVVEVTDETANATTES